MQFAKFEVIIWTLFKIKICQIYLLYTFKIGIHSWLVKCDWCIQKQLQRGVMKKVFLRNGCSLTMTAETFIKIFLKNNCEISLSATLLKMNFFSYFSRILISSQNSWFFFFFRTPLINCIYVYEFLLLLRYWFFSIFKFFYCFFIEETLHWIF